MYEKEETINLPPSANGINRVAARAIDLVIVLLLFGLPFIGYLLGLVYLCFSDMINDGSSIGKTILKIKVIEPNSENGKITAKGSFLRNLPASVTLFLFAVPLFGIKIIGVILGLGVFLIETYFVFAEPHGLRLGDILGETEVIMVDEEDQFDFDLAVTRVKSILNHFLTKLKRR